MNDLSEANRRTVLKTIGTGVMGGMALSGNAMAQGGGLARELAVVRSATAEYNDPANAYADGYVHPDPEGGILPLDEVVEKGHAVCGMGFHFGNFDLFGTSLDPTKPAVLAYGVDDDDNLVLGAVEWVVSKQVSPTEPDIFEHDDGIEVWQEDSPFPGVWSMHAWVHNHNPEGVFHPTNSRELFHPDGCTGGH